MIKQKYLAVNHMLLLQAGNVNQLSDGVEMARMSAREMLFARQDVGSELWWREIASCGTPWLESLGNGLGMVTFFWRDPQGDEVSSPWRRVWINLTGLTDHHSYQPAQSLQRIPGTDVWFWQLRLSEQWRGSYCLIPATDTQCFVCNDEPLRTMQSARHWWRSQFPHAIADPLNPHRSWRGARAMMLSALHMPQAPQQSAWQEVDKQPTALPLPVKVHQHFWHSPQLGNSRRIWLFSTGGGSPGPRPLAILLDGQFWASDMPVWQPLALMTEQGKLPAAHYLLIDSVNSQQRAREMTCNPCFWLALQRELLPQVSQWLNWQASPETTLIAGQSFGGLSALYAALHWPQHFSCVLSQSGSFWWPHREITSSQSEECPGWLVQQVQRGLALPETLKIVMQAGSHEPLIQQANQQMLSALRQRSHRLLHYQQVEGGHDALCWRGGLLDGLQRLWSSPCDAANACAVNKP